MHGKSNAEAWQRYVKEKMAHALSRRSGWFLFLLAFVVVYREVFETILFYAALWAQGNGLAMLGGATAAGCVARRAGLDHAPIRHPLTDHPVLFVERHSHRDPGHRSRWKGRSGSAGGRNLGSRTAHGRTAHPDAWAVPYNRDSASPTGRPGNSGWGFLAQSQKRGAGDLTLSLGAISSCATGLVGPVSPSRPGPGSQR